MSDEPEFGRVLPVGRDSTAGAEGDVAVEDAPAEAAAARTSGGDWLAPVS